MSSTAVDLRAYKSHINMCKVHSPPQSTNKHSCKLETH